MEGPAITSAGSALLAFMLAGAFFLVACGGGGSLGTVQGFVTAVQAWSITEIESLSVRDDAGKTWMFTTEGPLEPFPAHLNDHMLNKQQVRVVYEKQEAGFVAVSILDYP